MSPTPQSCHPHTHRPINHKLQRWCHPRMLCNKHAQYKGLQTSAKVDKQVACSRDTRMLGLAEKELGMRTEGHTSQESDYSQRGNRLHQRLEPLNNRVNKLILEQNQLPLCSLLHCRGRTLSSLLIRYHTLDNLTSCTFTLVPWWETPQWNSQSYLHNTRNKHSPAVTQQDSISTLSKSVMMISTAFAWQVPTLPHSQC